MNFYAGFYFLNILVNAVDNRQKLGVKAPPIRIDSQAKYGALSRGDGAIYLRFPHKGYREKIWDHAAGSIVVTGKQTVLYMNHSRIGNTRFLLI